MARTRITNRDLIIKILIALDKLEMESPIGVAKEIGSDPRTIRRAVREFHGELGLVITRLVSRGKKSIEVYKISSEYLPIWNEVKKELMAKMVG